MQINSAPASQAGVSFNGLAENRFQSLAPACAARPLRGSPLCGRQIELEHGTSWFIRTGPKSSSVRFDDRMADRQAHTDTPGLRRVERLEQAIDHCSVKTGAVVSHGNNNGIRGIRDRADMQLPSPRVEAV